MEKESEKSNEEGASQGKESWNQTLREKPSFDIILHHMTTAFPSLHPPSDVQHRARTTVPVTLPFASHRGSYLEFHGGVLLILGGAPALVVQVVRRGGMDKRGLLRLALAVLARQVHCQGQEPRSQEAGHTSDYQVDETEPWRKIGRW